MSAFFRFLTGLATAFVVVPSLVLVMPERLEWLNPWAPEYVESPEVLILAAQEGEPARFQPDLATQTAAVSASGPEAANTQASQSPTTEAPSEETPDSGAEVSTTAGAEAAASSTSTTKATGNEVKKSTTTTSAQTTTQPAPVGGSITGQACPCTVTGTAELSGKVDLQGDLIVDGGTLVARPGVEVDGNGFQIMFMNGGKADFQGTKVSTWSNNGKSQNLKRDIVFRNMRRIMWMGGGPSTLKYFTVADSGTSTLGDYPMHWHLNGDRTRGTIVEGVVVINGRNHAFVPHGSHGITFRNTIAKNITGDAYWWDPPGTNGSCSKGSGCSHIDNSNDILYDHALADGVKGGRHVTGFLLGGRQQRDRAQLRCDQHRGLTQQSLLLRVPLAGVHQRIISRHEHDLDVCQQPLKLTLRVRRYQRLAKHIPQPCNQRIHWWRNRPRCLQQSVYV